jgi:hydroxymethylglutaryl-CoA lyase
MAADQLTGNMASENVISFLNQHNIATGINTEQFAEAMRKATAVFPH